MQGNLKIKDGDDATSITKLSKNNKRKLPEPSSSPDQPIKMPLSNKVRAQRSRDRKKQYSIILEKKIKLLEEQVKILTIELDK
jgi:hypothetical protein